MTGQIWRDKEGREWQRAKVKKMRHKEERLK